LDFKILISTVDDAFLERKYHPNCSCIIINQLIKLNKSKYNLENVFSFKEKGLSRSRNRALELCHCDIALLGDDDVTYIDNIEEVIKKAFKENPDADIITFQATTPTGKLFKNNYKNYPFVHNARSIMRVSSIEIAFRVASVKRVGLKFDEDFGLGSRFPTGEEVIFLHDAIKRGLKAIYVPTPIVSHPKESSGAELSNPKLLKAKGALFYKLFRKEAHLVSLLFTLKKYKKSNYSWLHFYKLILRGIDDYKQSLVNNTH